MTKKLTGIELINLRGFMSIISSAEKTPSKDDLTINLPNEEVVNWQVDMSLAIEDAIKPLGEKEKKLRQKHQKDGDWINETSEDAFEKEREALLNREIEVKLPKNIKRSDFKDFKVPSAAFILLRDYIDKK